MQVRPHLPGQKPALPLTASQKIGVLKRARHRRLKLNRMDALRFAGRVAMQYAKANSETPFALTLFASLDIRFKKQTLRQALGFPPLPDENDPFHQAVPPRALRDTSPHHEASWPGRASAAPPPTL